MRLPAPSPEQLTHLRTELPYLRARYRAVQGLDLRLDLTRGKPSPEQLVLSEQLLALPGVGHHLSDDGQDVRNYGGPDGLPELRRIFSHLYDVPAEDLWALANGSLRLMHDTVAFALLHGVPGSTRRWLGEEPVKFVCPVPGYDRHFAICEGLGIEMINVPMTDEGPDIAAVRDVVHDPQVKGMWLVPTYSNPSGQTTTEATARALMSLPTAAPDFRVFWDDAYALHHLSDDEASPVRPLRIAAAEGNPDRPFFFTSTSKITFAGSGVAFMAASKANLAWLRDRLSIQTIGPDKINHLRHAMFFRDAEAVREHMRKHRAILAPKFAAMSRILRERLAGQGVAEWTEPKGGYFICLDVLPGTAKRVVQLAQEAGVALTPAGSTFPYGHDPLDSNIRLAPSLPPLAEVEAATKALATCVLLAAAEQAEAATVG